MRGIPCVPSDEAGPLIRNAHRMNLKGELMRKNEFRGSVEHVE